jgi:phosphomannomutase
MLSFSPVGSEAVGAAGAVRGGCFLSGRSTPVADVDGKLREIEERYAAGGQISHLDGVSVDFDDWRFNVRPSSTEPLLRLNLEALDEPEMERRRDRCST